MFEYIKIMEKRLSEEDAAELKSIYEPKIVAVPPGNARRQFAVMPDGEIRSYDDKAQYYIYYSQKHREGRATLFLLRPAPYNG